MKARRTITTRTVELSPLSRAVGNIFLGVNRPLVPCRLFTSEPQALAWLRGLA